MVEFNVCPAILLYFYKSIFLKKFPRSNSRLTPPAVMTGVGGAPGVVEACDPGVTPGGT